MGAPRVFPLPQSRAGSTLRERVSYRTSMLQTEGGSEQRLRWRARPMLGLTVEVTAAEARWAQLARYLQDAAPEDGYLVPWWPAIATLGEAAASGATTLAADLTDLPVIEQGGPVPYILWRSPFDYETLEVESVSESGLVLASPLVADWTANASLLPLVHVHLEAPPATERHTPEHASSRWEFRSELVTGYTLPAGAEIYARDAYLGLDVLTSTPGDASATETSVRRTAVVAADAGREVWDSQDAAAGLDREVLYRLPGRAAQAAMRRFHASRAGALVPFWVPSWDHDLLTSGLTGAGSGLLVVQDAGYTDALVESGPSRAHLAIRLPSGAWDYLEVGEHESFPNGVAALELWTPGPSESLPPGHPVSILRHCRLGSDVLEIEHWNREYAETRLSLHELAADCPTAVTS